MRPTLFILIIAFAHVNCKQSATPDVIDQLSRDTTITPSNAYDNMFLDSLQVAKYLDGETDDFKKRITQFYNARNYEFAWFNDGELNVQAQGFWDVHNNYIAAAGDSSIFDRELHASMDTLLYSDSMAALSAANLIRTELLLTRHFFIYAQLAYGPKADPGELQWHIPSRKLSIQTMLDTLLLSEQKDWQPLPLQFRRLLKAITQYREIERNGGWQLLELPSKKLRQGAENSFIPILKQRLAIEGFIARSDTSAIFNDSLLRAVKASQDCYGLDPDGIVDASLVKQLNVPVTHRIKQMLLNLERMRWMPAEPEDYIAINIPEYRFRIIVKKKEALRMDVVVGKSAHRTVVFSDELEYIVFSPYWNVPRSIVRSEIVPAMKRNSNYLQRNNMEITGYSGDLPIVRQKPGRGNALGQVKFIFPNNYNIYFHDTPARSLFSRSRRAFSHGCIRLKDPFRLAKYLLQFDQTWTDMKIKKAMSSNKEKWVTLQKKWPVFITYFTSWADQEGRVYFLEDVYGHDQKLANQLFKKQD